MLDQFWAGVVDVGPTLVQHWVDVSCFLGMHMHIDIQVKREELTQSFMMISNWKRPFSLHDLYKIFQRCKGWSLQL